MERGERKSILGTQVCVISFEQAMNQIEWFIGAGGSHYVCFGNVHSIMESKRDERYRRILNEADMAVPDGMALVWALRLLGKDQRERIYGPDIMLALCQRSLKRGYSHFFYGGGDGVAERLANRLVARFPGLRVAGYHSPPYRQTIVAEEDTVVENINKSGASLLWVGLGAPKQEEWMSIHRGRIRIPVMLGVGAAFDFLSGNVKQAPPWIRRHGLEWLFRLLMEPRRLWKRYLYDNPLFICRFSGQLISEKVKKREPREIGASR